MEWAPFRYAVVGLVTGGLMLLAAWLFSGFVGVSNALAVLNFPATAFSVVVSGNVHAPSDVAFFLGVFAQWFILGYIAAWLYGKFRSNRHVDV